MALTWQLVPAGAVVDGVSTCVTPMLAELSGFALTAVARLTVSK